jgi:hypothetical protein
MLSKVFSAAVNGVNVHSIDVEVDAGYSHANIATLSCNLPMGLCRERALVCQELEESALAGASSNPRYLGLVIRI